MINRVVVVGAGHAAGQFSARLRTEGFDGELVLLGDEPVVPYQRPPLSKAYLSGEVNLDRVLLRKPEFYAEQNVDIRLSTRVDAVDRDAKKVTLEGGESLEYGQLVFATGARVRKLNLPGFDLPGVHYVRNLADSDGLRDRLADGQRVVVSGERDGRRLEPLSVQSLLRRVGGESVATVLGNYGGGTSLSPADDARSGRVANP